MGKEGQTNQKPETDNVNMYLKLYLETQFQNIHGSLNRVEEYSKKNENAIQGVIRTINQMQLVETLHFTECPNTAEIATVKATLSEFLFFKKYYKVFLTSAIVLSLGLILGGYKVWQEFTNLNYENKKLKTEIKNTQGDVLSNEQKTKINTDQIEQNSKK